MARPEDAPWRLIAVLRSTGRLGPELTLTLFRLAAEIYWRGEDHKNIVSDEASGTVRSLGRDLHLGVFGGPGFEATLDTPDGPCAVNYILTQEGLEHARALEEAHKRERERWN